MAVLCIFTTKISGQGYFLAGISYVAYIRVHVRIHCSFLKVVYASDLFSRPLKKGPFSHIQSHGQYMVSFSCNINSTYSFG